MLQLELTFNNVESTWPTPNQIDSINVNVIDTVFVKATTNGHSHRTILTAILRDGYITKKEMLNLTKRLTQAQGSLIKFYLPC